MAGGSLACLEARWPREMVGTIAIKIMMHDRVRFFVTVAGIALSLVLVSVQLGLLIGFDRTISSVLDHTKSDLWIVPTGSAAFDDPAQINSNVRFKAYTVRGVQSVTPMLVGYAEWRKPDGGSLSVIVVGCDPRAETLAPWNISLGDANDLKAPDAVAVDASYADELGVHRLGDVAQIEQQKARVFVITSGIRSFTTSPYVFTSLSLARRFLGTSDDRTSYFAVKVAVGADLDAVRRALSDKLPNVEVLTTAQFRRRNVERWLLQTGAGIALLSGAALAVLIGGVIMTQTLFSSVNDHRREFATMRAMGSSKGLLRAIVLTQASLGVLIGAGIALIADIAIAGASAGSSMPIEITARLMLVLVALAACMSMGAAWACARKIAHLDPATVFAQ